MDVLVAVGMNGWDLLGGYTRIYFAGKITYYVQLYMAICLVIITT